MHQRRYLHIFMIMLNHLSGLVIRKVKIKDHHIFPGFILKQKSRGCFLQDLIAFLHDLKLVFKFPDSFLVFFFLHIQFPIFLWYLSL